MEWTEDIGQSQEVLHYVHVAVGVIQQAHFQRNYCASQLQKANPFGEKQEKGLKQFNFVNLTVSKCFINSQ